MLTKCPVCLGKWNKRYSGRETRYVPSACSANCFKDILNTQGMFDPKESFQEANVDYKIYTNSLKSMRSNYERSFMAWLEDQKIEYRYEPWILTFPDGLRYVPDFYLPFSKIFIEVKGLWEPNAWNKFLSLEEAHVSTYLINDYYLNKIIKESCGQVLTGRT